MPLIAPLKRMNSCGSCSLLLRGFGQHRLHQLAGVHVDGHGHGIRRIGHGTQEGQRADNDKLAAPAQRLGLAQERVQLQEVQLRSRIRNENGVFCIMAADRRLEAPNTLTLKVSLSPALTTDDQKRM